MLCSYIAWQLSFENPFIDLRSAEFETNSITRSEEGSTCWSLQTDKVQTGPDY